MPRLFLRSFAAVAALLLIGQASFATSGPRAVTVRSGDSLWGIAYRYHVPIGQLAAVNGMQLTSVLLVGRRLVIPGGGSRGGSPAAGVTPAGGASPPVAGGEPATTASVPVTSRFSATQLAQMRSFCATYRPPSGPAGALPASLTADPGRLALRPLFVKWARAYGVSPDLAEAVAWQESGWQNDVVSGAGAQGIGQLLPGTTAFLNTLLGTRLQVTTPEDNIRLEIRYLAYLQRATGNQTCAAVASYYQGFGMLERVGVLPESQRYVSSVLALRSRFR